MSHKNEQNINISNSSNVSLGDVQMNVGAFGKPGNDKTDPADAAVVMELKSLVAEGKLKAAIDRMLVQFKGAGNTGAINRAILHAGALTQLELQENINVITHDQAKIDRAKLSNALLQFIDDEIG